MRLCLLCLFLPAYLFLVPVSLRAQHNQGLEVDRVVIRGNQAISTDDIITALGFESGNVFDRHTLDQNINRMLHAYADQGYLWTEITSLDIQFSPDSSAVSFTLHIREGPVARVDDIELAGNVQWEAYDLLAEFDSRPGGVFDAALLERDIDRLLTRYDQHGFPYCRIEVSRIQTKGERLTIQLTIHEGPFIRVDGFRVEGNKVTKSYVITREFRLKPGEPFDQRRLNLGRTRLLRSGLFTGVNVPELDVNSRGDGAIIVVHVQEDRFSTFDGIMGYAPGVNGNGGFLTGNFTLSMNNLGGAGRRVEAAWIRRDPLSSDIRLDYEEPWMFGIPLTVAMNFGHLNQDTTFTATQFGLSLKWPLTMTVDGYGRLGWRRIIPDSLSAFALAPSRELNARLGLTIDSRDHVLNPLRGAHFELSVEFGLRFNESRPVFQPERSRIQTSMVRVDIEQFIPTIRRHTALIGIHVVNISTGEQVLPVSQQIRFGGTRTLRGYRENEFQGARVAWSNFEYRILLSSRSRFFTFFDAGYFESPRRTSGGVETLRETKIGYGLGIRLESSLGILGIDYGIGEEDSPLNGKVHIRFRNAF